MACQCQAFGKSGVPWPSGKCMVCGEQVNMDGAIITNRLTPEDRYLRDPMFHHVVDILVGFLERANYTPTELREAALLAATIHESRTIRPVHFGIDWGRDST